MSTIETTPSVADVDSNVAPASGQADGALPSAERATSTSSVGFPQFLRQFRKYESVLDLMVKATSDDKFKQEVATIDQWFRVLSEPEKNASVHSLLVHCSQDQLRFLQSIITSMIKPEEPKVTPAQDRPRLGKLNFRPPSLSLPDLNSPTTPTPVTAKESAVDGQTNESQLAQALGRAPAATTTETPSAPAKDVNPVNPLPGFSGINPYTLNMLANAGLSKEAQLLAAQLVMSGIVQPTGILNQQPLSAKLKKASSGNWRTPASARFPASALRSSGLRQASGLKSAGLKSSTLAPTPETPISAGIDSPRLEDFDPELLQDIPAWLRSLRLHKYTQCFDGLTWQEIVYLDDATLEAKGVVALGARRRLLRSFEHVRKEMGMEDPNSATPTTSTIPALKPTGELPTAPHSAFPRSKLSINSPIFTPTWEANKTPQSAVPVVAQEANAATHVEEAQSAIAA